MFSELEALVAVAETGSIDRAANVLHVTSSALTRRVQRLESELGLVLLDRHFKPLKLTRAGKEVLGKSRAILSSVWDLKSSSGAKTMPSGTFRLGLATSLARSELAKIVIDLGTHFPLVRPNICTDVSPQLLHRLHVGDLDAVLVILPMEAPLPSDLRGVTLAQREFRLVQARTSARTRRSRPVEPHLQNWVLCPPGCLLREEIKKRVEKLGASLRLSAELHDADLQLSLIAGDVGVGIVEASLLRTHPLRARLRMIDDPGFNLTARVAYFRGRDLGAREQVALKLEKSFVQHFRAEEKTFAPCIVSRGSREHGLARENKRERA